MSREQPSSFEVPVGLVDMLQAFTVAVLRNRPTNLNQFAADYFSGLSQTPQAMDQQVNTSNGSPQPDKATQGRGISFVVDNKTEEPPKKKKFSRRKSVASERYDPEAEDESEERVVIQKTAKQRERLLEACKPILLFRSLEDDQIQILIDAMFERKCSPGDHIITEGEDGDNFYIIDHGEFDIFVGGKKYGVYKDTGSFGELALMYNQPRAATIVATSNGVVWGMDRKVFRRIVLKSAYNKRKVYEALIENVPMLKSLSPYERMNVADALIGKQFQDGECVIKQGEKADCMYFIELGQVRIMASPRAGEPEKEITIVKEGGFFGELALLTHKPRAASAYAHQGTLKVAVLDVAAFERLLGPCMNIMKRNISSYEQELREVFADADK